MECAPAVYFKPLAWVCWSLGWSAVGVKDGGGVSPRASLLEKRMKKRVKKLFLEFTKQLTSFFSYLCCL
jgi:hypothetical protein